MSIIDLPKRGRSPRQRKRDHQHERMTRRLRRDPAFAEMPPALLRSFAGLTMLADELRRKIAERGLFRPDGEIDAAVDVYRRLVDSQTKSLVALFELRQRRSGSAYDLPRAMLEHVNEVVEARNAQADGEADS